MAGVHHVKIKNTGKKARIGNIDIRLNLEKENASIADECRDESTINVSNPQQLQEPVENEEDASSDSFTQDETESESEIDIRYTDLKKNLKDALAYTDKLLHRVASKRKKMKENTSLKMKMKNDKNTSKRTLQNKVTEYFKKDKVMKTEASVIKGSPELMVYGLGSYFEEEHPESPLQLTNDQSRFSTFYFYEGNGDQRALARNGFHHNRNDGPTSTKCFYCGFTWNTWGRNDDVPSVHRQRSPNCTFINRSISSAEQVAAMESVTVRTNITERQIGHSHTRAGVSETYRLIDLARTRTVQQRNREEITETRESQCGEHGFGASVRNGLRSRSNEGSYQESGYGSNSEFVSSHENNRQRCNTEAQSSNMQTSYRLNAMRTMNYPKHLDYVNLQHRLDSFSSWQNDQLIQPRALAEAGFFYAGFADCVRCYFCDGGLQNWEAGDDPLKEHLGWFPRCKFITSVKEQLEREQTQRKTADVGVMDPMTRRVIQTLEDMGFKSDVAKHAVMAVKNQTSGQYDVMLNEAVTWALDQESNNRDDQTQPQACVPLESSDAVAGATGSSPSTNCQDVACLKAENQQLRELLRCKICLDRQMEVTFLPCGHLVCCFVCAANIHKCPFCRKEISGTTNTGIPH